MKLTKILLCSVAAVMMTAAPAMAKDKKKEKKKDKEKDKAAASSEAPASYQAPYGMAGCGLGSLVIKTDNIMQIFAVTLNGTGFQTIAISSVHSSNCTPAKADQAREEQEVFIAANMRALEEDVTSGGGDYAHAFAEVLGCGGTTEYAEFLETSRANYRDIFASADPADVHQRYLRVLRANPRLATCERMNLAKT